MFSTICEKFSPATSTKGPNKRSYRGQPVSSGRRQRTQDWLQAIEEVREEEEEEEEEEDQGAVIDSDNSSELSEIPSLEVDRMDIASISSVEGSSMKDSGGDVLRTRSGRAFGI